MPSRASKVVVTPAIRKVCKMMGMKISDYRRIAVRVEDGKNGKSLPNYDYVNDKEDDGDDFDLENGWVDED